MAPVEYPWNLFTRRSRASALLCLLRGLVNNRPQTLQKVDHLCVVPFDATVERCASKLLDLPRVSGVSLKPPRPIGVCVTMIAKLLNDAIERHRHVAIERHVLNWYRLKLRVSHGPLVFC